MSRRGEIFLPLVGGSLGDVQATVAVATELRRQGFSIEILALPTYRRVAHELGIDLDSEWTDIAAPELFDSPWELGPRRPEISRSLWRVCTEFASSFSRFSGLVSNHHSMPFFLQAALAADIPIVSLCPMPFLPTREFNLFTRWPRLPVFNRQLWQLGAGLRTARTRRNPRFLELVRNLPVEIARMSLGDLESCYRTRVSHCVNVSPLLLERPRDWSSNIAITGYSWPRSLPTQLPEEVAEFLARGKPPVLVSLGSARAHPLRGQKGKRRLDALLAGLRVQGKRAIIQLPDLADTPAEPARDALFLDAAQFSMPHQTVLPYCESMICHGGAGTIHTALRAGVPAVIRPRVTDQFFWAERLASLGVSPPYRAVARSFSKARFTSDLAFAGRTRTREKAQSLGARLAREEDGARAAAEYIAQRIRRDSA